MVRNIQGSSRLTPLGPPAVTQETQCEFYERDYTCGHMYQVLYYGCIVR